METDIDINKKLTKQKIVFCCCWVVVIALYFLGKSGLLPWTNSVAAHSQCEYLLQVISVFLVLADMFVCVRFFKNKPICTYLHVAVAILCEFSYFATGNKSFGVMALMVMVMTFLCFPKAEKLQNDSDKTTTE